MPLAFRLLIASIAVSNPFVWDKTPIYMIEKMWFLLGKGLPIYLISSGDQSHGIIMVVGMPKRVSDCDALRLWFATHGFNTFLRVWPSHKFRSLDLRLSLEKVSAKHGSVRTLFFAAHFSVWRWGVLQTSKSVLKLANVLSSWALKWLPFFSPMDHRFAASCSLCGLAQKDRTLIVWVVDRSPTNLTLRNWSRYVSFLKVYIFL